MSAHYYSRIINDESGAAPIRFVFIIIILVVVVSGLINLGWILNGYITINNAAREGAKIAVVNEESPVVVEEIEVVVKDNAGLFEFREDAVQVSFAEVLGRDTVVTVKGDLTLPVSFPPLLESVTLQGSASMKQEK